MPYVEGGDVPAFVYATNAKVPPLNDWCVVLKLRHSSPWETCIFICAQDEPHATSTAEV